MHDIHRGGILPKTFSVDFSFQSYTKKKVPMIYQIEITLRSMSRGFHLVTGDIMRQLPKLPKTGLLHLFTKHTSCGLSINENCDPEVRIDLETTFNHLVPENRPGYQHTLEGSDDMPAHAKSYIQ
jgi:secondary thiamine-phosphate synthase enzyme